ncbi:Electron transfer flavoprotein, beta subunit [Phaffia rhodozyma]|uniref:Probable electron transfer flavoprotein subunit beta n=1 Tax=Phaffia rhodozyma TaxID=264483 RepID=A0A0F7SLP4_PHARH|nr:Electron transfer flavoprotein, beta subunit [Phaffia rhodozyma]
MRPTIPCRLNILVPVKRAIDYTVKVRIAAGGQGVDQSAKHSMNPFDEIAVEESLRLRAKHAKSTTGSKVDKITVVTIGPTKSVETLRTALAMGADDAIHIKTEQTDSPEPLAVAKLLASLVKSPPAAVASPASYDLLLLGKQAIDSDASQTGSILAGLLGWGQATFASTVEVGEDGKTATVTREIDGGLETVQGDLPMVVTTDLRLNEPRYATLPNIMKAKKKPLVTLSPSDFPDVDIKPRVQVVNLSEPAERKGGGKVESVEELVKKLQEAGLV